MDHHKLQNVNYGVSGLSDLLVGVLPFTNHALCAFWRVRNFWSVVKPEKGASTLPLNKTYVMAFDL